MQRRIRDTLKTLDVIISGVMFAEKKSTKAIAHMIRTSIIKLQTEISAKIAHVSGLRNSEGSVVDAETV